MDICRLADERCIEQNIRAQVDIYSRVPSAAELTPEGAARLAALIAGRRPPADFEVLELNLKGRPRGPRDRRSAPVFDGTLSRADVTVLMEAARVNSDRYIRDIVAGAFMENLDRSPTDGHITAAEWLAAGQQRATTPAPAAPAPTGVALRPRS